VIHHTNAVRQAESLFLVVRDQDGRSADFALNLADGPPQVLPNPRVQRSERFIEKQNPRFVRKRPRDRDALLLAARKLCGHAIVQAFEPDQLKQVLPPFAAHGRRNTARPQRELDVLPDTHVPEERIVLEDEADLPVPCIDAGDVLAMQHYAAAVDRCKTCNGAQQGALAAAGRAQQNKELPVANID
jgi:hypothetical protein